MVGQKTSGKKEAPEFKRSRLEPKLRPFWSVWLWASPFPLKASFPHLGGGNNTTTYLMRLWGWNTFLHVKSLTQKRFFFLLAHHSLNRDRQRVHSKWCAGSLHSCFLLFHYVMSFGKILTEAGCSPQSWPHALKSSLLTNGAEASAVEPWTAPLLSHCWLPEGAKCLGGFSQERLCSWEGLGFTRAAVSQHACHLHSSTNLREASHCFS